jgi:sugar O-acyltransferase (sialic acid O-acetyltransferase NeuD family)
MKQLLIIGARGFGRSIFDLAVECPGYGKSFAIKGYLDDNVSALDSLSGYPPIVGSVEHYEIAENDVFICALGSVKHKKFYTDIILAKGGVFTSLIHPSAHVSRNAVLGAGCIVARMAHIGCDVVIGEHVLVQTAALVGHDCTVGNFVRIDSHVVCVGGVKVEDEATIHSSAVLSHNVTVGAKAVVGGASFVIRSVPPETTVFGNPAKRL